MPMCLVWQELGRKNNPQPKAPDWSTTEVGDIGSSRNTPKSIGEGGDKNHPWPNTPKQPHGTEYELRGPH